MGFRRSAVRICPPRPVRMGPGHLPHSTLSRMPHTVNVGLIGVGTVGTGVARGLLEKGRLLRDRTGCRIALRRVCDRNFRNARGFSVPRALRTNDASKILRDPDIHIVVELIGGLEPAKSFILEALRNGKHVVTANKALLAHAGRELFAAASKAG